MTRLAKIRPALAAGILAANLAMLSLFDHFSNQFTMFTSLAMIACCLWLSLVALRNHHAAWLLLFLPVALLWNPIVAMPIQSAEWFVVYAAAAIGMVCAAFFIRPAVRPARPTASAA